MTYYRQDENGEYVDATEDVNNIVKSRLHSYKESSQAEIREEVEKTLREELTTSITSEVEEKVTQQYKPQLEEATTKASQLETKLRQTTIAAEYGFKPGTEKYLGEGTEEEMRKEAETLKTSFTASGKPPKKETGGSESKVQKRTGITVEI